MAEDLVLKNAQYRKAAPMAFLNSRNTAMEMVKMEGGKKDLVKKVKKYTNDLMKDYQEFYAKEVASVGAPYKVTTSLDSLKKVKTIADLQKVWQSYSEDERHDGEIIKAVQALKNKLLKKND